MRAAGHALEVQRLAGLPVVGYQLPAELFGVLERMRAFAVAGVEPQPRLIRYVRRQLVQVAKNAFAVPPDAGRKHRQPAEVLRMTEPQIKRDQTT